ncbi:MAG: MBL fold metallo-hydrolase [Patescibacteria group bacterium]
MVITYYGLSCFKIETNDLVIGLSPFAKNEKLGTPRAPRFKAQVVLISQPASELYNYTGSIEGEQLTFDSPGEYEVGGVFIYGFSGQPKFAKAKTKQSTIFMIKSEGLTLAYLGGFSGSNISEGVLESLGDVDLLILPIGGGEVCDSEQAVSLVSQIEPKIVIPMHYQLKGLKIKLGPLEDFAKEINLKPESLDRLSIKKIAPAEELKFISLEPQNF